MLHRSPLCGLFSIFFILFIVLSLLSVSSSESIEEETLVEEFIICRHCGTDVSITNFFLDKISPQALSTANHTFFNHRKFLVQTLENSAGVQFKVAIVRKAHCSAFNKRWSDHFTWFPGYKWKVCLCPKCKRPIGWLFEPADNPEIESLRAPSNQGFYALIFGDILSETFVNSLLMTEKHHSDL